MKMSRLFGVIFPLSVLILASCEFKPKGDYFRDLVPTPPAYVNITLPGNSDTLVVNSTGVYTARVDCGSRKVLFYRIYINGVQKAIETVSNNSFDISPGGCVSADGVYRMSFEVGINTGSGSIADVLKAEGYIFRKEYILARMLGQYSITADLKYSRQGGSLKLSLDLPPDVTIVKKGAFSRFMSWPEKEYEIATVTGTSHYETSDPCYVGQYSTYHVTTYASDSSGTVYIPYFTGNCYVNGDLPVVTTGTSVTGYPLLKWTKTHYPANCGGYRIYNVPMFSTTVNLMKTINDINDTTYEVTGLPFPGYYELHLAPFPRSLPDWYTDALACNTFSPDYISGNTGLDSFTFTNMLTPNGSFLYYSLYSDILNEYSTETGNITNQIHTGTGYFYTYSVSPNGQYLLAATGLWNFSYFFYNLASRQSTLVPSSMVIGPQESGGPLSVSDNGVASIVNSGKVVVYDFLHQTPLAMKTFAGGLDHTVISANGQFVFVMSDLLYLYKITPGTLEQIWSSAGTTGTVKYFSFISSQPPKAVTFIGQTFSTMYCEPFSIAGTFAMDVNEICNIDFGNGHILGKTSSDFKVYDLVTGTLQFQNPTGSNMSSTDLGVKKNTVYYSGGKKLIIF